MATSDPNKGGWSPVPIVMVVLAVIVVAALYISVRSQPNYTDEGELGDQPAPVETST